nr:uncharacterized protein LOC133591450 [Nerophis lumbriciformis]
MNRPSIAPGFNYIDSLGNPYLEGVWQPVFDEIVADKLEVIGEVPRDLNGVYLRNGPNPRFQPRGRYHVFDGDGMLHAVEFDHGKVTYRNRWVRSEGLAMEEQQGQALWRGLIDRPDRSLPKSWGSDQFLKDNSNTDVIIHNGEAISTFYQCGDGYRINPRTLETEGRLDMASMGVRSISAHPMVDEYSGEMMWFDYSTEAPFMTYGVINGAGELTHHVPIDLPGARLPHTLAITENHTILMDLSLFWDPELLKSDIHKVTFFPDMPSRFGIIPRHGSAAELRWFDAEPNYIYHVTNAWEEGAEIVLDGCRMGTPEPPLIPSNSSGTQLDRLLSWGKLDARLYRWRFNLKTGETREEWRDDRFTEFPTINGSYAGRKTQFGYHMIVDQVNPTLQFTALAKYELDTTTAQVHEFDKGCYASESPFAPRDGSTAEDDGYLVTFVTDEANNSSELQIFDARTLVDGPIGRVKLPVKVPPGFHSCWGPDRLLG